jgi:two-component system sensor histidine kinase YesM
MLIQPLVENAVLHGLEPRRRGDVQVTLRLKDYFLEVCVKDEGHGIEPETLERLYAYMKSYDETGAIQNSDVGIGVLNVYRRFRLFYGEQGEFDLKSKEGEGTCVTLLMPVE